MLVAHFPRGGVKNRNKVAPELHHDAAGPRRQAGFGRSRVSALCQSDWPGGAKCKGPTAQFTGRRRCNPPIGPCAIQNPGLARCQIAQERVQDSVETRPRKPPNLVQKFATVLHANRPKARQGFCPNRVQKYPENVSKKRGRFLCFCYTVQKNCAKWCPKKRRFSRPRFGPKCTAFRGLVRRKIGIVNVPRPLVNLSEAACKSSWAPK